MRKRNKPVLLYLNEQEWRHLAKQAKTAGLSRSAFLRNLLMGVQLKPRPPDEYAKLLLELSAIGNNLNQLARIANSTKSVKAAGLQQAAALAQDAARLVRERL